MEHMPIYHKFCVATIYHGNISKINQDEVNVDAVAQAISSWAYVSFTLLIAGTCCLALRFRLLNRVMTSPSASVFVISFAVFIVLGCSASPDIEVFWCSRLTVCIAIGIVFLVLGNKKLFVNVPDKGNIWEQIQVSKDSSSSTEKDPNSSGTDIDFSDLSEAAAWKDVNHVLPLGAKYSNIQFVIGLLTFAIVTAESMFAVALATAMPCRFCALELASVLFFILQKIFQAIVYASLAKKIPNPTNLVEAVGYLQLIGFINFGFWLDNLSFSEFSLALNAAERKFGGSFKILNVLYGALLADHRLLCGVLFIEHAFDILREVDGNETEPSDQHKADLAQGETEELRVPIIVYSIHEEHYKYLGYAAGFSVVAIELFKNLKHVKRLHLPPAFATIGLLTHLVIAASVVQFFLSNPMMVKRKLSGVNILVACMGATGVCYFMFKAILCAYWISSSSEAIREDASWAVINSVARIMSLLFLMALFLHSDEQIIAQHYHKKRNQFLIPFLKTAIFGLFLGSLMEFHESNLDRTIICRTRSTSLATLFSGAPPLYLGFLLHSFAKIFMGSKHATKRNIKIRRSVEPSSLEERLLPEIESSS